MASQDNKRFYWLKLKKDFFQQHQIKVLKSLPNGRLYALIYLELLAESTSHEGELRYSKMLPYDTVTLAAVIDEDKDNVEKAIETFVNLELVEILDDGTIFMREIDRLIGSETGQTIRKREARIAQSGKSGVNLTLENRVKSIELREKEIYKEKHKYGEYKNVLLSDEELSKLKEEFPDWQNRIERVSSYCASTGKSYKNYLATIRNWARKDQPQEDKLPVYSTENNVAMEKNEEDELLKLMGKK